MRRVRSLDAFSTRKLAALEGEGLLRSRVGAHRSAGARVVRHGRALISFACNDYLGLSHDPRIVAAGIEALQRFGAGAGGARLVTGEHPLLAELEAELAAAKGTQAALVFGSGYLANLGVTPALVGPGDLVCLDALSHACMWAGARLSGARVEAFAHNDAAALDRLLAASRGEAGRAMVLTERVFSMDGDRAPVAALLDVAACHDAWTMVDDAHGLGVVGPDATAPLELGTLSKALGSYGGYVCGSQVVIELLRNRARTSVYATALPPAAAASALAALRILHAEPERTARPLALARRFTARLGLDPAQSAIVPVIVGAPGAALDLSAALERRGYLVVAIRPPTVPNGSSRLRFAFSAAHGEAEVDAVADALAELASAASRAA